MKLTRTQAIDLLIETGCEAAEKFTNERLKRNVSKLIDVDDEDEPLETETPECKALLETVLAALANKEEIEIVDDAENEASGAEDKPEPAKPLNKKQRREAKKAADKAAAKPAKPAKKAAEKKPAADKPAKTPKPAKAGKAVDKFGFTVGGNASKIAAVIGKKPKTMAELMAAAGLDKQQYGYTRDLVQRGLVKCEDGKFSLVE